MISRPVEILLVEDSPGDVWLTRETLRQGSVPKNISVVSDGEQAIDFLRRRGRFGNAPRPDLILLDLNLPRLDGLDVLREVKRDPALRAITVVVLTTSEAEQDVNAVYDLNANCYMVKPVDLESFTSAIRGIEEFWMSTATLPSTQSPFYEPAQDSDGKPNGPAAWNSSSSERHAQPYLLRLRLAGPRPRSAVRRNPRLRDSISTRHRHR